MNCWQWFSKLPTLEIKGWKENREGVCSSFSFIFILYLLKDKRMVITHLQHGVCISRVFWTALYSQKRKKWNTFSVKRKGVWTEERERVSVYVWVCVYAFKLVLKISLKINSRALNKISSLSFKGPDMWQQIMLEKEYGIYSQTMFTPNLASYHAVSTSFRLA